MKKFFLLAFIFFDVILIGVSVYVLYQYLAKGISPGNAMSGKMAEVTALPSRSVPSVPASTMTPRGNGSLLAKVPAGSPASAEPGTRKILFSYRSAHAKQVAIRAEFTGWKAEPMQKGANGVWTYQAALTPGEYAYCFTVDDKTFKDPANKRTKQIGRTLVSAITVAPK